MKRNGSGQVIQKLLVSGKSNEEIIQELDNLGMEYNGTKSWNTSIDFYRSKLRTKLGINIPGKAKGPRSNSKEFFRELQKLAAENGIEVNKNMVISE